MQQYADIYSLQNYSTCLGKSFVAARARCDKKQDDISTPSAVP